MPVIKRFVINKYLENSEGIDEHSPYFNPNYSEEEEIVFEEKRIPTISFFEKWKTILKSFFQKK